MTMQYEEIKEVPVNNSIKPGDLGKIISMGGVSLMVAMHLIGNNIILASLGGEAEQAAVSLITSIQNVSSGLIFGILLNAGVELGEPMAKGNNKKIGDIIKTSWLIGVTSGIVLTGFLLSLRFILPHIVAVNTAKVVTDFFNMFCIGGAIAEPMVASNGIIISLLERHLDGTNWKSWGVQLASMASYRLPALTLGYVFAKKLDMGPPGIGLATAISGMFAWILTHIWFRRNAYQAFELYSPHIVDLKERVQSFLNGGWKLSLRRLSEWGNLAAISLLIGAWSNKALKAFSPFSQANTFIGFGLQGMSQGAMVFIGRDAALQRTRYEEFTNTFSEEKLEEYRSLQNANRSAFHKNNMVGLGITFLLSAGMYLAKNPLVELFMGSDIAPHQKKLAESFLLYGLIGLLPDALRILASGILGAWNDVLYPTLASLLTMTLLGVGIGGVVSATVYDKDPLPILWFRIGGMATAAAFNYYRFFIRHMKNDTQAYLDGKMALKIIHVLEQWENSGDHISTLLSSNFTQLHDVLDQNPVSPTAISYSSTTFFEAIANRLNQPYTADKLRKKLALKIAKNSKQIAQSLNLSEDEFLQNFEFNIHLKANEINQVIFSALNDIIAEVNAIDKHRQYTSMPLSFLTGLFKKTNGANEDDPQQFLLSRPS